MLSKNQVKHARQLHSLKFRKLSGEFIAEGPKVVGELLNSAYTVKTIYALPEWLEANSQFASIAVQITTKDLAAISHLKTPNQVFCIVEIPKEGSLPHKNTQGLCLVLDGISDPGNMGTIIRTADWFGIRQIICSPHCVDVYNPKVVQATMGSISRMQMIYSPLEKYLSAIPKEKKIYGAYLRGDNIFDTELVQDSYLIIGSESHGISEEAGRYVNQKLTIPNTGESGAESLNASIATAIFCAEFKRRSFE